MMALTTGLLFLLVFLFAPQYGVIGRALNQLRLGLSIVGDDILGFLYRYQELSTLDKAPVPMIALQRALNAKSTVRLMAWRLLRQGLVQADKEKLVLTDKGMQTARGLIRSHRLWETYLCNVMGYCHEDVHRHAHHFEHVTDPRLQEKLREVTGSPDVDPHQRSIP
jgi:Mn-dependent DtxR family transcriptional regulator